VCPMLMPGYKLVSWMLHMEKEKNKGKIAIHGH
jgi:hypothetical protein